MFSNVEGISHQTYTWIKLQNASASVIVWPLVTPTDPQQFNDLNPEPNKDSAAEKIKIVVSEQRPITQHHLSLKGYLKLVLMVVVTKRETFEALEGFWVLYLVRWVFQLCAVISYRFMWLHA